MKHSKVESPYRKVETHTWEDDKFRRLAALPPCGQGLWLYLLTNPYTVTVPGLFCAGRAAMAEALGWDLEAFDKAFAEVFTEGMAQADWKARVVWLPNSLRPANAPESPNVAVAWRRACDRIPECDLKQEAIGQIRCFLRERGGAYLAAFDRDPASPKGPAKPSATPSPTPIDKPLVKASGKPSGEPSRNQEQEQITEERDTPRAHVTPIAMRRRLYAAFEWRRGHVHQDHHAQMVAKLGGDAEPATRQLMTMYAEVARDWPDDQPVGSDWAFWWARFDERFGKPSTRPASTGRAPRGASDRALGAPLRPARPDDVWGRVLSRLEAKLNQHTFLTWLAPTALVRDGGERLEVSVADASHGAWIARHYDAQIAEALASLGREGTRVEYVVEMAQAVQA